MLPKLSGVQPRILTLLLASVVISCAAMPQAEPSWVRYADPASGQSLVYPNSWSTEPDPQQAGGQIFRHPNLPVQVRIGITTRPDALPQGLPNFVTAQRQQGWLSLQPTVQPSTFTLRLAQESLIYTFEASADRERFNQFLPYFYYMASQYAVGPTQNLPPAPLP